MFWNSWAVFKNVQASRRLPSPKFPISGPQIASKPKGCNLWHRELIKKNVLRPGQGPIFLLAIYKDNNTTAQTRRRESSFRRSWVALSAYGNNVNVPISLSLVPPSTVIYIFWCPPEEEEWMTFMRPAATAAANNCIHDVDCTQWWSELSIYFNKLSKVQLLVNQV
jgi:hypothetical protein